MTALVFLILALLVATKPGQGLIYLLGGTLAGLLMLATLGG